MSDRGAVFTQVSKGTSQQEFEVEWREICLLTVGGELIDRCELFDEADLDAALARFDELSRQAPRLENAASKVDERFWTAFGARDWVALSELVAEDILSDDRRHVVNAGVGHGRDAHVADARAAASIGPENTIPSVVAIRGERLALTRVTSSNSRLEPNEISADVLCVVEIDADDRIMTRIGFDLDDIDAAFEELDARYLAGEAAPYASTWSLVTGGQAALNRNELPPISPDCATLDHRRGAAFAQGEMIAYLRAGWELGHDVRSRVEVVHRLSSLGAVYTNSGHGASREGFDAEWRGVTLVMIDGDLIDRCELFDEADLDAALERFDELSRPAPQLENAASRTDDRFEECFAARDWRAMGEMMVDDVSVEDRRRVVNAGVRLGRDVEIANMQATADLGVREVTSSVIAIRGDRLALSRNRFMGRDQRPEAFHSEALCIIEIDADERIVARVSFDIDDIDGAFAELDPAIWQAKRPSRAHMVPYRGSPRRAQPPRAPWIYAGLGDRRSPASGSVRAR